MTFEGVIRTQQELEEALRQWDKAELCRMGESDYLILSNNGPIGVARTIRRKIKDGLVKEARRLLRSEAPDLGT